MSPESSAEYDYVVVGGGLHGALIALSVMARQPRSRLVLVERSAALGGNHVWCFHASDVSSGFASLLAPLVETAWPAYDVRFPGFERRIDTGYAAVTSRRLHQVVSGVFAASPQATLLLDTDVTQVSRHHVLLADGRSLHGKIVIQATGPGADVFERRPAFQKFVGLELELSAPSPRALPLLMDAQVEQRDGYRFFYVLPFASDRVLIEDTYFSGNPDLDTEAVSAEILGYAAHHGYAVKRLLRREIGVLPLPLDEGRRPTSSGPLLAGYGGGLFHPTTGYSFPLAARVAELAASTTPELLPRAWSELVARHRRQFKFGVLLNRLLYGAFAPEDRHHVIERFYRLPEPVLARFYAMTMTQIDRARVFCDKPPRGFSLRLALAGGNPR